MVLTRRVRSSTRVGFTLMEVLVVVAILVILAGVASVAVFGYLDKANYDGAKLTIAKIETAVMAFKVQNGDFPAEISVLAQPLNGMPASLEQKDLIDPWGQPYVLDVGTLSATGKPRIYSPGPPGTGTPVTNFD